MKKASDAFRLSPVKLGTGKSVQAKRIGKALVVEADYFALTSRIDPSVIFWDADKAKSKSRIPEGVTHLWISGYTLEDVRSSLSAQAQERNIQVWKCPLVMLRERLLPFWGNPANRSMIMPVQPDENPADNHDSSLFFNPDDFSPKDNLESAIEMAIAQTTPWLNEEPEAEDRAGEDEDAIPQLRGMRRKKLLAAKVHRLTLLKKAAERIKSGKIEPPSSVKLKLVKTDSVQRQSTVVQSGAPSAPTVDIIRSILVRFPVVEREVFSYHYSLNERGVSRISIKATATEFGLTEAIAKRLIQQVWARFSKYGLTCDENKLLRLLGKGDR